MTIWRLILVGVILVVALQRLETVVEQWIWLMPRALKLGRWDGAPPVLVGRLPLIWILFLHWSLILIKTDLRLWEWLSRMTPVQFIYILIVQMLVAGGVVPDTAFRSDFTEELGRDECFILKWIDDPTVSILIVILFGFSWIWMFLLLLIICCFWFLFNLIFWFNLLSEQFVPLADC